MGGAWLALAGVVAVGLAGGAARVTPAEPMGPAQVPPVGVVSGPLPGTGLIGPPAGALGLPLTPPGGLMTSRPAQSDVAYGADPRQRLDLYLPATRGGAPVVLFVHGGGWSIGDKAQFGWVGEQLAAQGVVAALANYRLSPAVQHPEHTKDVARAAAWLYRHAASYGGEPTRLYLVGHSAGAHLAALVALDRSYLVAEGLTPAIVRGVVGIAGPTYDLDASYAQTPIAPLLYAAFGPDPTRWAQAAPVRYVQPYAPGFLLIYGTADTQALPLSTQALAAALQRSGVPVQVEPLAGQDHFGVLGAALAEVRRFAQ
ncbi:MAG TPA: alpha/beta hydrolase [Chloroflexota bacterium]|nr:alpha/beta hydrolase [Chloroflexota bacterium]